MVITLNRYLDSDNNKNHTLSCVVLLVVHRGKRNETISSKSTNTVVL